MAPPVIGSAGFWSSGDQDFGFHLLFSGDVSDDGTGHPKPGLGTITDVRVGGVSIARGVAHGSLGWLQCGQDLEVLAPPYGSVAEAVEISVCNADGCVSANEYYHGGAQGSADFANNAFHRSFYDGFWSGILVPWAVVDLGTRSGLDDALFQHAHFGQGWFYSPLAPPDPLPEYEGGAATLVAFVDAFSISGAAGDMPWDGGGWTKLWESADLGPDGEGHTGRVQAWVYPNAPRSVLQGEVTWAAGTGEFVPLSFHGVVRIFSTSPCDTWTLLDESAGPGFGTLSPGESVIHDPGYIAWLWTGAAFSAAIEDAAANFGIPTGSGGQAVIGSAKVDFPDQGGFDGTFGMITNWLGPPSPPATPGPGGIGAIWRAEGQRNNTFAALGQTIWDLCCGCSHAELAPCAGGAGVWRWDGTRWRCEPVKTELAGGDFALAAGQRRWSGSAYDDCGCTPGDVFRP